MTVRKRTTRAVAGLAAGVLVTSLLAALGASPAAADPAGSAATDHGFVVDRDGTVRYRVDLAALPGYTIHSDSGTKQADGSCSFSDSGSGKATGKPRVLVISDLSINPKTCARQTVRATYSRDALPAAVKAKLDKADASAEKREGSSKKVKVAPGADTAAVASGTWAGSIYAFLEDPIWLDVTSTKSDLFWSFDGTYLYSSHWNYWDWLWQSGWHRDWFSWSNNNTGTVAYTDTRGNYTNDIFCALNSTYADHPKPTSGERGTVPGCGPTRSGGGAAARAG